MKPLTLLIGSIAILVAVAVPEGSAQYTWTKDSLNPIVEPGGTGAWETQILAPWVIFNPDSGRYEMWYSGGDPRYKIGFAVSDDGITWVKDALPVLTPTPGAWDSLLVLAPSVIRENGGYKMWYTGAQVPLGPSSRKGIGYATSPDGRNWTKVGADYVLGAAGSGWEDDGVEFPAVIPVPGGYEMFYGGFNADEYRIGRAFSADGINWDRDFENNPVFGPGEPGTWDHYCILPRILVMAGKYYMYYTGFDVSKTIWAIGLATSADSGKTWSRYGATPVITKGDAGAWDHGYIETGSVYRIGSTVHLWYDGGGAGSAGHATAPVYVEPPEAWAFTKDTLNPIVEGGDDGFWERDVATPWVLYNPDSGRYEMWYTGSFPRTKIGFAVSADGETWVKDPLPVLTPSPGEWDSLLVLAPCVIRENGGYKMWYTGAKDPYPGYAFATNRIGYATSPDGRHWTKYEGNPVLGAAASGWEDDGVEYGCVLPVPGGYQMFYGGIVPTVSRIGRAFSPDGVNWERDIFSNPVFDIGEPGAWDQQVFLPRILRTGSLYHMYYTAYDETGGNWAIGLATSGDSGRTWERYGTTPVLATGGPGSWDQDYIETGSVLRIGATIHLWYDGGGVGSAGRATAPAPAEVASFNQALGKRWNLVSVPMDLQCPATSTVYPGALSSVYHYAGAYHTHDSIECGTGFWLKAASDTTYSMVGEPAESIAVPVEPGWNMIGSVWSAVAAANVRSDPPGLVTSQFFGYDAGYHAEDSIRPGRGYWVKVGGAGTLMLSASAAGPAKNAVRIEPTAERPPSPPDDGVREQQALIPAEFRLDQNYPNPFNPSTRISYALPEKSRVELVVFNLLGEKISTLVNGEQDAGFRSVDFGPGANPGVPLPSGIYVCRITATSLGDPGKAFTRTMKMILLK